jgi:hypothetical protein
MPIKVQCDCGKALAAKDELAGKTVKCPGCQKPLKIPGAATPQKAGAKPTSKPGPNSTSSRASGVSDLFDEAGLHAAAAGTTPCPGCQEPLAADVVVCVKCGYNMKLGRRMQTMKTGGGSSEHGGGDGHGSIAQDLMEKAAAVIDGDEDAEASKTTEGMPWWVYLIILLALIGFGAFMLMRSGGGEEESKDGKKASRYERDRVMVLA